MVGESRDEKTRENDAVLEFHCVYFKSEWVTRSGADFQTFFEDIMSRADDTFIRIAPAGRHGDRKSDGFQTSTGTIFQVYAPPTGIKTDEGSAKIKADFEGAKDQWPEMKAWTFVWSSPRGGLPPDVAKLIAELDAAHDGIEIRQWGIDALWRVVRGLPEPDRNDLLRPFPAVRGTSDPLVAADVSSLLNSAASMPRVPTPEGLTLTAPKDKLAKNQLGVGTEALVQGAMTLLPTVQYIALEHPDPGFNERVASALRALYERRALEIDDADALFLTLVRDLAPDAGHTDSRFWAAAAIITRAFEICDVFEP